DGRTIAGSLLPQGEDAAALLNTIAPWLDEAQRMRTVSLRHVPEGSDALDQRSCLVAPLVVKQRLLGYLYADLDGAFGRFHDTDRDLLGMLAAQAAVALDNAQWAQGLERKVEERTAQLDERVHELEIINGIQQGVGAELDFQAIVDLVGDKLREVFKTGDMSIRWWDEKANRIQQLYTYEHGVRLRLPASAVNADGPVARFLRERKARLFNSRAEQEASGITTTPGTDAELSFLAVPIMAGERILGAITVSDHERENAFGPADVRLVSTIASRMGVALLNARSYEAERQRSAELAIINSIQQGISGSLDFQGIVDLVGDKLREVLHVEDLGIQWFDVANDRSLFLYACEHGERLDLPPMKLSDSARRIIHTREPTLYRTAAEQIAAGHGAIQGTDQSKSVVVVPIIGSDRVLGILAMENYERENAYGETELRLLQTVAGSLGVALENARLFDETQRRAREAAALADVGRELSSSLDLSSVMNGIARHAKDLLSCDNSAIFLPDEDRRTYRAIVAL
ncbi:MAG TPA: GAF domain-containing protein, partial [Casimicrobiaceae bacterium]